MRLSSVVTAIAAFIVMPGALADEDARLELKLELPEPYFGGRPLD